MIPPFKTVGQTCNFGWKNKFKIHWTALNYNIHMENNKS